jgi:hypothetical protein
MNYDLCELGLNSVVMVFASRKEFGNLMKLGNSISAATFRHGLRNVSQIIPVINLNNKRLSLLGVKRE